MPEFRKLFDLPATKLSRSDVEALGRLICEGLPLVPKSFEFVFRAGDTTYSAYSLVDLLAQELPDSIDSLEFRVHGWNGDNIDRGVTINLGRITAFCQVHSLDEVWFKGKTQQLVEFFTTRRPWYGTIRPSLVVVLGALQGMAIPVCIYFLWNRQFLFALASGFTVLILGKSLGAIIRGSLFPLTNIHLGGTPGRINKEIAMVIFTAIGAIGTVVGVIVQLFQKGSP